MSAFARLEGEDVLNWIETKPTVLKDLKKKCLCLTISCFGKIEVPIVVRDGLVFSYLVGMN